MIYLSQFTFPDIEVEYDFIMGLKRTCYDTVYPFQVLSKHGLRQFDFETITILYGGNGSGKSTALNVMAEKLGLSRDTLYNRSNFFEDYTRLCGYQTESGVRPHKGRIITSDDVFDFMLDLRTINEGVDHRRETLLDEYMDMKYSHFQMRSLEDYERLKKVNSARRKTQSKYVREYNMDNVREHSNGESAFAYFTDKITENGLFLLDEPENSLSPERQRELVQFIGDAARFYACQFVIATHSPFLLSMKGTKIYDLDEEPVDVKRWTQLENVRAYYDFFMEHAAEFERG